MISIVKKQIQHANFVKEDIISVFGSENLISVNKEYEEAHLLDGFIAMEHGSVAGILLYSEESNECELVYLHSLHEGKGVAKKLIKRLLDNVKNTDTNRLFVITTNDNINAIKLYQQSGFRIKKVYHNAMQKVREKKPMIPLIGYFGIPLQDMIELEYHGNF